MGGKDKHTTWLTCTSSFNFPSSIGTLVSQPSTFEFLSIHCEFPQDELRAVEDETRRARTVLEREYGVVSSL